MVIDPTGYAPISHGYQHNEPTFLYLFFKRILNNKFEYINSINLFLHLKETIMRNKLLKEKIMPLRQQGLSYNEISKILHCSKGSISYHCASIDNNHQIKNINTNKLHFIKNSYKKWDDKIKQKIKILFSYGIFTTEIADVLNLNIDAMKAFCKTLPKINYSYLNGYDKVKRRRKKIKILAVIYKGGKCKKCGYDKYFENLEFHHKDPSKKEFTIAKKCNNKWQTIKKELDKCMILCSTCHRELHVEQNPIEITPSMLI